VVESDILISHAHFDVDVTSHFGAPATTLTNMIPGSVS